MYIPRALEKNIEAVLGLGKSILLLGPRQTGKTTLMEHVPADKRINLANLQDRLRYEKNPAALAAEIEAVPHKNKSRLPLVIIDEIQKIPLLMDSVQDLIDRKIAKFIITGSSARKLRNKENANLLPGRVIPLRLDPLMQSELLSQEYSLQKVLLDGSLPEIILQHNLEQSELLLEAYVTTYLEEEIRAEAVVRNIGHFSRFLELAAAQSGRIVNFSKLSQEIGVAHGTIIGFYQILEDCLVAERIEPIITSKTRKKLSRTQKYLLYDLGVRRVAAREGRQLPIEYMGHLFEQYIGLELIRLLRLTQTRAALKYWRDPNGPEIDWVIDTHDTYIPIEVKYTKTPTLQDAKHLQIFLNEYSQAIQGFIVCQTPHMMKLAENIIAVPWRELNHTFDKFFTSGFFA